MLCYALLFYAMLCYAILCYASLRYAMLIEHWVWGWYVQRTNSVSMEIYHVTQILGHDKLVSKKILHSDRSCIVLCFSDRFRLHAHMFLLNVFM